MCNFLCVVQIPRGTSSHTRIRMRGKGIRKVNGIGHGDHYINLKIRIPTVLTNKQESLLKEYAALETDTPGTIIGISKTKGEEGESQNNLLVVVVLRLTPDAFNQYLNLTLLLIMWLILFSLKCSYENKRENDQ